jgi:hypothetical protein
MASPEMISVAKEQLETLLNENKLLKSQLIEGATLFKSVVSVLGIGEGANSGTLMLKIPKMIHQFQQNPKLIDDIVSYIDKIQIHLPDERTN